MKKRLRTGYTTGACAAAATKAALLYLLSGKRPTKVELTLPTGTKIPIPVAEVFKNSKGVQATVIKDAGDDPDVTNGAEIVARVRLLTEQKILIRGGKGVGVVTKPGLPVPPGEPAINPTPRQMIEQAAREVLENGQGAEITIIVPEGEKLAQKTLNPRLGIVGGISILGTTGLVKPVSAEAWLATIETSLSVARALGLEQVVLSFGRASELSHMKHFGFPEEAYVPMGDYVEFSVKAAFRYGFKKIDLCGQWAKLLKCALVAENPPAVPEDYGFTTHVRHGMVRPDEAQRAFARWGIKLPELPPLNTARELLLFIQKMPENLQKEVFSAVLKRVKKLAQAFAPEVETRVVLISYQREVLFVL
ncbi:cobalt-precorrin-5B (C(1))-methyltransferase CbiD [Thermodesulfatator atlanticus]|uniref:cobalt-precorrin-5B (C(1))-methyltransferase CbiD n=1 Tax=Thermodesulfatator atlanticus TaxID=501497 RepID=UPI0003B6FC5B|nr:cobalt-precorrin-5B (C(1))-methyltransferase CbiD [Thermodesulfatator atlanticus]